MCVSVTRRTETWGGEVATPGGRCVFRFIAEGHLVPNGAHAKGKAGGQRGLTSVGFKTTRGRGCHPVPPGHPVHIPTLIEHLLSARKPEPCPEEGYELGERPGSQWRTSGGPVPRKPHTRDMSSALPSSVRLLVWWQIRWQRQVIPPRPCTSAGWPGRGLGLGPCTTGVHTTRMLSPETCPGPRVNAR